MLSERLPRLSRQIRDHLARRIVEGSLAPGDQLPSEQELARDYAVSKPVIREALSELAALDVVEIRQGRSSVVRPVGADPLATLFDLAVGTTGLADMLELRLAVECRAAALAAAQHDAAQLAALAAAMAALRASLYDGAAWTEANWRFHQAIVEAAGNRLFRLIFQALGPRIREGQRTLFHQHHRRVPAETLRRHQNLFDAIAARDAAAAEAATHRHFALALSIARTLDAG